MSSKKIDPPDDDGGGGDGGDNHGMKKKVVPPFAGVEEGDEADWPICVITSTATVGATGTSTTSSTKKLDDGSKKKSEGQPENKKVAASVTSQNSKSASTTSPAPASKVENHSSSNSTEKSTEKCTTSRETIGGSSSSSKQMNSSSSSLEAKKSTTATAHHEHDHDDNGLVEKSVKPTTSIPAQKNSFVKQVQASDPSQKQHNRFLKKVTAAPAPSTASTSTTNSSLITKDKPKDVMVAPKPHVFKKPAVPPPTPSAPALPLYACPKCDLEFTTRSILNTHLNDAHPIVKKPTPVAAPAASLSKLEAENSNGGVATAPAAPTGPPYDCPECNHRFPNPFQLKKHSIIHNKPLQCPLCPQTYLAMEALNLHKRYIHDSSKLHWFKCQICGKCDFLLLSDLYTHRVESHPEIEWMGEKEKPFGCGICQRPFLRKGDALVCAVLGHEAGQIYDVMFQWRCSECPGEEGMLGFWRVEELRRHWEEKHNDKEMPEEVVMNAGAGTGGGEGKLPCVQIDKREAYDLKERWTGEGEDGGEGKLILEFDLLEGGKGGRKGGRGCVIPVFGCPDCLLTFVDVESLRIHEKVHLRDEGPPMPSPVKKRGRPPSKTGRNGEGQGEKGAGASGVLQMMGSPDKHQEPISLVGEDGGGGNGGKGKHLIPKYDCQVCGKRFRKLKRLRDHEQYHKMEDPNCPVFPKVVGRGGRKKGSGGGGGGQAKTAMQKSIAHAGGILRKRGRGRPKKVTTVKVPVSPREMDEEMDEDMEEGMEGEGEGERMEWWEEALLDEEDEMEFKCKVCDAAFHMAKQLRMHELAAHNAPHRKPGRKPRRMVVNGEGEVEERLKEVQPPMKTLKKKMKKKVRGDGGEGEVEMKPVRPGRIKVGRLEISTKLNKEIKDSVPIRLSVERNEDGGRKGPQYKCPKCPKEFRDKRGIHLHILGHSLNGAPGEKQRNLDEGVDAGEEFYGGEMGEQRSPTPGDIGGERRTSDRERKVPRKLSDFEVEEDGGDEEDQRMEVDSEEVPPPPAPVPVKVIEAPPVHPVKVSVEKKKKMALPKELYGEVVKNMTILQAEGGKMEERKEVPVQISASLAVSTFEKIGEKILGMKKDQMMMKKKMKIIKPQVGQVPKVVGKSEVEGGGPPVPDYYGDDGQGTSGGGGGCDKVTCQTCLKTFESVEDLWYHCTKDHFNKGGKVKCISKGVPTPVVPVEAAPVVGAGEGESPKKELKTYGSAKKPAFLALLEKKRELDLQASSQGPPKVKVQAPATNITEVTIKIEVDEEIAGPSQVQQVPATTTTSTAATVSGPSQVVTAEVAGPTKVTQVPATEKGATQATQVPVAKEGPSQVPTPTSTPKPAGPPKVQTKPTSRPPPPALIPLNTITGRDNNQQKNKSQATPPVPASAQEPANIEDKQKKIPPPPPAQNLNKVSAPANSNNKQERKLSTETPKSKPEVKVVTPNLAETIKMVNSSPKPIVKSTPPEVKTSPPKVIPPVVKTTPPPPQTVKPAPSPVKPEVTKTFTIKSNPDLSISIVKTRPTQQVFTSTSTSSSTPTFTASTSTTSTQEPKPEVSISLVKARQQQLQMQHQKILTKQPSQLSVSIVKPKAHVPPPPPPPQFPKNVPNYKLSELIRCASKKHPLIQNQLQQQQQLHPQLPKLSRPPPLTPAPGATAARSSSSPPKQGQGAVRASTPPKLEGTVKRPEIQKRKIILVNKSSLLTSPPKYMEETLKKIQIPPSSSLKAGPSAPAAAGGMPIPMPKAKLEETLKKKPEVNQVISPSAPAAKPVSQKMAPPSAKMEETLKKKTEVSQVPPKVEEIQKPQVSKTFPPKILEVNPKKKIILVANPSLKLEEPLIKKQDSPVIPPPVSPATPKAVPNLEETLKKKQDNQLASQPPKLKENVESQPVKVPPQKLEDTQKKPENKIVATPPPTKPAASSVPPKLEETSVEQKKIEKPQVPVTPLQSVRPAATPPKMEESSRKPEPKKVSPPPTKPAQVQAPSSVSIPPKLEEPSVQKKSQAASCQKPVNPNPAPPKLEEPLNKPETQPKKISPPTKPTTSTPTPPPKKVEETPPPASIQVTASQPPPKLEETSKGQDSQLPSPTSTPPITVPPQTLEETPNQSASSSSARVVASAPLSKSPSSTENPPTSTPLQQSSTPANSNTLQKPPPLSSPTANEFRFKIIKQSVILPFKKRAGRPSPKYLEYLEGKQKGSSKKLLKSQSSSAETPPKPETQQENSGGNPPLTKKSKLTTTVTPESQPIKMEVVVATESTPAVTSDPPIKRKRGRPWPPKIPTQTTTPIATPASNGAPIKRKRGRPWPPKVPPTITASTCTSTPPNPPPPSTPTRTITKPSPYSPDITTSISRRKISEGTGTPEITTSVSNPEDPPPLQSMEIKPKAKPGRPRIHPIVIKDPNAPKRRRGRPSKAASSSLESSNASMEDTSLNGSSEDKSMNDSSILSSSATDLETLATEGGEGQSPQIPQKKRGRPFKKRRGRLPYKSGILPVSQAIRRHSTSSAPIVVPTVGGGGCGGGGSSGGVEKRGRGRPRKSMPILTPAID